MVRSSSTPRSSDSARRKLVENRPAADRSTKQRPACTANKVRRVPLPSFLPCATPAITLVSVAAQRSCNAAATAHTITNASAALPAMIPAVRTSQSCRDSGISPDRNAATAFRTRNDTISAPTAPGITIMHVSHRDRRTKSPRDAPSASRMNVSWRRLNTWIKTRLDTLAQAISSTTAETPASQRDTLLSRDPSPPRPGTTEVAETASGGLPSPRSTRRFSNTAVARCSETPRLTPCANRPTTASQKGPLFARQSEGTNPVAGT